MKIFHTTQKEIELNKKGSWGDFLFFSRTEAGYGNIKYSLEIDEDDILCCSDIEYSDAVNEEVNELIEFIKHQTDFEIDEDTARELLSESSDVYSIEEIASHYVDNCALYADLYVARQSLTARAAKKMGYNAVEVNDEFGKSYMIDAGIYFDGIVKFA